MTPDAHRLVVEVARAWPPASWRGSHVVLAVSGGADSVALFRAAVELKQSIGGSGRLIAAHLHHGWRGAEADEDVRWLDALCRRWSLPLEVGRAEVQKLAAEAGDGWEAAARSARYDFLERVAANAGARYVAVAHTADDQAETVLHRIVRGTGLAGLAGIPRVRPLAPSVTLVRPLLDVRRQVVIDYLAAIGQDYRTDATNADSRWTRNRLRNELLPALRADFNPEVDESLRRLAHQSSEAQAVIAGLAEDLAGSCVRRASTSNDVTVRIDCRLLSGRPPIIVREVCKLAWANAGWPLQAMGFDEWQQLAEMCTGRGMTTAINLPCNIRAHFDGEELVLAKLGTQAG